MELFKPSLATLTGGSGAVAVLLTDGSFSGSRTAAGCSAAPRGRRRSSTTSAAGASSRPVRPPGLNTSVHLHRLGRRPEARRRARAPDLAGLPAQSSAGAATRSTRSSATRSAQSHRDTILKTLGHRPSRKDFSTYPYLGNMGTVSLPLTAALAEDREFLEPGDRVALPRHRQRAELPDAGPGMVNRLRERSRR